MVLKRFLSTAQTWFPWSRTLKFSTYNQLTRRFGAHVEQEFRLLADLPPIRLALDVGGNWGQSVEAMRYYGRPEKIITFEPNPPLARRLQEVHRGDPQVEVNPFGLAERESDMTLYVPSYRGFVFDGLTSFDPDSHKSWLCSERIMGFSPHHVSVEKTVVHTRRLDDLNLAPDVVKLDVQGYEQNVLEGGARTFARCRPFTILEDPSPACVSFFAGLGMSSYVMHGNVLKEGETRHLNTLFLSAEHIATLLATGNWQVG